MKILHYFLGFPPYRTGGLTKYAMDLMTAQIADGHVVMALWPGQMKSINKTVSISQRRKVSEIENYELINPLPVPLDEGIKDFDDYMKSCDKNVYNRFLLKVRPEVIHIHTLMGLHKEFIEAVAALKIRTVFTTHDYFGICPKVILYKYGQACEDDHNCAACVLCNNSALSLNKIRFMQSPLYRVLKNSSLVKLLRKKHRLNFFAEEKMPDISSADVEHASEEYRRLRAYYIGILEKVDFFHFNSTVTESVYKRYLTPKAGKVVSITHRNVLNNKKTNVWQPKERLRITCLAPAKPFKGFLVLKDTLDDLWNEGRRDFELKIYSPVSNPAPYMLINENGFDYSELGSIMAETDILVAPSIWYETFGFTVLEAISYGVPVIVSNYVGAKDIIGEGGIIVEAGDKQQLKHAITSLSKEKLRELRKEILLNVPIKLWEILVEETYHMYENV